MSKYSLSTRKWKSIFRDVKFNVTSILLVLFFALPVYYVVTGAFMTRAEVYAAAVFPSRIQWENLRIALFDYGMLRFFGNSLFITLTIVALNLFFCSMSGLALAKYDFPGKQLLFSVVLVAMMIPPLAMIVPLFLEVRAFGWLNSPLAVIVPSFVDPFGIFLMRQYILDIPEDFFDAARVEGCSEFRIFWSIVMPIASPALSALLLYRFLFVWNDLFWPLLVLGEKWRTLPVAIEQFGAQHFAAQELQLTTSLVGALPILIILVLFTRQVNNAVLKAGGLK